VEPLKWSVDRQTDSPPA